MEFYCYLTDSHDSIWESGKAEGMMSKKEDDSKFQGENYLWETS